MAVIDLAGAAFEETLENNDLVLIDFWAEWCGPCKSFGPIYEKVSEKFPDVVFAKVNTEVEQELAGHFQIRSIPTIMIVREKVVLMSQAGVLSEQALEEVIAKAKELDMDDVRRQIAEAQNQEQAAPAAG